MIDTKLILIEGVPCSGKSTTARKLKSAISACGIECQCFLEWAADNPIFIGNMENLPEIISTTKSRAHNVLRNWRDFTAKARQQATVTIMESRLWQTDAMYLYLSGHSEHEVAEMGSRIIRIILELNPVLIYLAPEDIGQVFAQVTEAKNRKWRGSGKKSSWENLGNDLYERQKWFTSRSLRGKAAIVRFFTEWASISDKLYEEVPFRKIKIVNPQANWETAMCRIHDFLKLK
jgi:hypothetical protein